jgi:hypothetical protein
MLAEVGDVALPLHEICPGPNAAADGALRQSWCVRQFHHWLEYDAAELEGNERKVE